MNDLTRRRFLTRGSLGLAMAGALGAIPAIATALKLPAHAAFGIPQGGTAGMAEPLVAHVRDLATGEISLLVGTQQVIHRDRELAARLYAAARQAR
jgi:hypothetical protein